LCAINDSEKLTCHTDGKRVAESIVSVIHLTAVETPDRHRDFKKEQKQHFNSAKHLFAITS
jgi:hypothetical protein